MLQSNNLNLPSMKIPSHLPLITCLAFLLPLISYAEIKLPSLFSDHMVLQRDRKVPIWGVGERGETIQIEFGGMTAKTVVDEKGRWLAHLPNLKSGDIQSLRISGSKSKNTVTLSDVAVGEVWICSGQSNMQWSLDGVENASEAVAASNNPQIRLFNIPPTPSQSPATDVVATWQVSSPESAARFSAVGYFFAAKLSSQLNVPIGMIQSAVGGTPAEAWTPTDALQDNPIYEDQLEARRNAVKMSDEELKAAVDKIEAAWKLKVDPLLMDVSSPEAAWFDPAVTLSGWTDVQVPGAVDTQLGLKIEGSFWVRKTFEISADDAAHPAILHLGRVDDFDFTWVNNKLVGKAGRENPKAWETPREYPLPVGTLKAGTNVVIVRVIDQFMEGGFTSSPSILKVETASGSIPLAGAWQAKLETDIGRKPPMPGNNWSILAGMLYNGMIAPLVPYEFRGVIWYQGESNSGRASQYRRLFPLMIETWRKAWKSDFPFYFVQLANFNVPLTEPAESNWAEIREAQMMTLSLANTALAVTIDIGEAKDIHPKNKQDVGDRLAAIALARDYGKQVPHSGPLFESMKISEGRAYVKFTETAGGLVARPLPPAYKVNTARQQTAPLVRNSPTSELEGFAICGEDKKWTWASAKIEGDTVIVWSDQVHVPVNVRYAWADNPFCNLYNGAGFPASPFRTDTPKF